MLWPTGGFGSEADIASIYFSWNLNLSMNSAETSRSATEGRRLNIGFVPLVVTSVVADLDIHPMPLGVLYDIGFA